MANPNEDDRMQKILSLCWCVQQAKLMQPSREQFYYLLILDRCLRHLHVGLKSKDGPKSNQVNAF
jgi:hypothetical protein